MRRLVVIGAGPMGLEAALLARERGFDVTILEKDRVGSALLRWGGTRLFSPLGLNISERARRVVGPSLPPEDALLTGPEMVEHVLQPMARSLDGRLATGRRVVAVGRARLSRGHLAGHPLRGERPFRILVETPEGEEVLEAEAVLDASGVCDTPAALGAAGLPARGERACGGRVLRHLGPLEKQLPGLAGRRVLLVGHGHSAATAMGWLERPSPPPLVTWAVRSPNRRPCVEIADDPLPERRRATVHANDLASSPPAFLTVERRAEVEAVAGVDGRFAVRLSGDRVGEYDAVVGLTGYRPDLSFLGELPLEISPVSEGPARLARAVSGVTDCLSVPRIRDEDLLSGEPGFHFVGGKSYGRLPTFLLKTGLGHLEAVFSLLESR